MYIPTHQTVLIHKPGESDSWGNVETLPPITLKCRAEEKVQLVTNQLGHEIVSSVELLFRRLPDIKYNDQVEYTNEIGHTIKREPQLIAPARGLSSKPEYTSVYL